MLRMSSGHYRGSWRVAGAKRYITRVFFWHLVYKQGAYEAISSSSKKHAQMWRGIDIMMACSIIMVLLLRKIYFCGNARTRWLIRCIYMSMSCEKRAIRAMYMLLRASSAACT